MIQIPKFGIITLARNLVLFLGLCLIAGSIGACGSSVPGRYYVLSSPPDLAASEVRETMAIGVGPVALPPHLDRTQIVTQATRHRLDLQDLDQWAEPLKDGITRVLAQNLSRLMGTDRVFQFPWRRPITVQHQVTIQVQRFDADASGNSVLTARWDLIQGNGRDLIYSRTSSFRTQVYGKGLEPVVAAMSANLAELSREIAVGLAALSK